MRCGGTGPEKEPIDVHADSSSERIDDRRTFDTPAGLKERGHRALASSRSNAYPRGMGQARARIRSTARARRSSFAIVMRFAEADTTSSSSPGFRPRSSTSAFGNRTARLLPHLETCMTYSGISQNAGYPIRSSARRSRQETQAATAVSRSECRGARNDGAGPCFIDPRRSLAAIQVIKARSRCCRSIRLIWSHGPLEGLEVRLRALEVRVLVTGLPPEGIEDVEGSPHQRLGVLDPIDVL